MSVNCACAHNCCSDSAYFKKFVKCHEFPFLIFIINPEITINYFRSFLFGNGIFSNPIV
ncbi:hypothetical protein AL540_013630 [Vibrio harveyi]|uniref:Uncharacterized protein n=1 Tax=Vibrio harveyi TaxID=669 RepID=A0A2S0S7N5_VIBHA|nr:hypothetical protein AL538_28250 [Vibrio harveyi]AWA98643.1 hypothetical protein CU052_04250 [Vibrio harveyi]PNM41611.1 hypothetical protein AL469_016225 [Vibrio harveyi]PNM53216.1 hypothetical protein AL540_013630 [Vibrio harveyi]QFQ78686.1 hypothetical protein F9277_15300 [Vibrio harveyi]